MVITTSASDIGCGSTPMHLTFRLINSFDYSTVFYVPVVLQGDQTLSEAIAAVHAAVAAGGGYRPIRHRLALYDTIRLYWSPGLIKATDRIFDTTRGENLNVEQHAASTIT